MSRKLTALIAVGIALIAAVVAIALVVGSTDDDAPDRSTDESSVTTPPVVSDEAWCAGWGTLVAVQAQYVADPTAEAASSLLSTVQTLRDLGVPESLDPAGYTELTAVLDDVRASADPSFTPSVEPSEPADVGDHHDHADGDQADAEHEEAPFGTWLADYCAA